MTDQDKKQKLFRLWAEKRAEIAGYDNRDWWINPEIDAIELYCNKYTIPEIQALMEADGTDKEEIENVLQKNS